MIRGSSLRRWSHVVCCGIWTAFLGHALAAGQAPARPDLTGIVLTRGRTPVAGATVSIYTAGVRTGTSPFCPGCYTDCGKHETTNARGRFRIRSLDPALIFRVLVVKDGFEPTFVSHVDPGRGPIKAALKERQTRLVDASRTAIGQVVDPSGRPVVGASVEPVGVAYPGGATYGSISGLDPLSITDERGEFHFVCPQKARTLIVQVKARGLATTAGQRITVGARAPGRIAMALGTTVTGAVLDTTGNPEPNVTVQFVPTDTEAERFVGWFEIGTNASGHFTLPNVPASRKYVAFVRMDSLAATNTGMSRIGFSAGGDGSVTGGLQLRLGPASHLTGTVRLSDGKPVPAGTRLMLGRESTWDQLQAVLGADGSFAFSGVPREEDLDFAIRVVGYTLSPSSTDYDATRRSVRFRIPAGTESRRIEVVLDPIRK